MRREAWTSALTGAGGSGLLSSSSLVYADIVAAVPCFHKLLRCYELSRQQVPHTNNTLPQLLAGGFEVTTGHFRRNGHVCHRHRGSLLSHNAAQQLLLVPHDMLCMHT